MHHIDVMLARNGYQPLEERQFHALGGRVARKVDDQHLRFRIGVADRALQRLEEIHTRMHRHVADIGAGDDRPVDVYRVTRIRHQHDVAGVQRRERKVGDAFLGADGDDRLGVGIEFDVVACLVPVADRAPQPRYALRHRVAVRVRTLHGLDQLVHDVARRGLVGIAHAEVDHVLAALARLELEFARHVENVRRKALYSWKFFHAGASRRKS